jgi:hypothetical protein
MKPVEPFLAQREPALAVEADSPPGGSLAARIAATAVLCAAVASIVWYVIDVVMAL